MPEQPGKNRGDEIHNKNADEVLDKANAAIKKFTAESIPGENFWKKLTLRRLKSERRTDVENAEKKAITFANRIRLFINNQLNGPGRIDWANRAAIDKFCVDLEKCLEENKRIYLDACKYIDSDPAYSENKWQELMQWVNQLRNQTKKQILKEIGDFTRDITPPPIEPPRAAQADKPRPNENQVTNDKEPAEKPTPKPAVAREPEKPPATETPAKRVENNDAVELLAVADEEIRGLRAQLASNETQLSDQTATIARLTKEKADLQKTLIDQAAAATASAGAEKDELGSEKSQATLDAFIKTAKTHYERDFITTLPRGQDAEERKTSINDLTRIGERIFVCIADNSKPEQLKTAHYKNQLALTLEKTVLNQSQTRFERAVNRVTTKKTAGPAEWRKLNAWISDLLDNLERTLVTKPAKKILARPTEHFAAADATEKLNPNSLLDLITTPPGDHDLESDHDRARLILKHAAEVAETFPIPKELQTVISQYTDAFRKGDFVGAAQILLEIFKLTSQQEQRRKDAEKLWEEEGEARLELEAQNEAIIATNEALTATQSELEAEKQKLAQARVLETELREQILELQTQPTIETPPTDVEKPTIDFAAVRAPLAEKERELKDRIEILEEKSLSLAQWIDEAKGYVSTELSRRRAVAADEQTLAEVRRLADALNRDIKVKVEEQTVLEKTLGLLQAANTSAIKNLEALRITQDLLKKTTPDEVVTIPEIALTEELPDMEDWLNAIATAMPAIAETTAVAKEKVTAIDGLPFTVEFSKKDEAAVRSLEQLLQSFKGKNPTQIARELPIANEDPNRQPYIDELYQELSAGSYAESLKLAIVVFGAMRKGNEFVGYMTRDIGSAMRRKEVGLAKSTREASPMSRSLLKNDLIASVQPDARVVRRGKALKWGPVNELTDLGKIASQVWTAELLNSGRVTKEQLIAIFKAVNKEEETE